MPKGFRLPTRTARLVFEGEYAGAEVVVKLDVSLGLLLRFLELQEVANAVDPDAVGESVESAKKTLELFGLFADAALVGWNLERIDGTAIPTGREGMLEVTPAFAQVLLKEWVEVAIVPPAPLVAVSSNGSTSATPLPAMAAE